MDKTLDAEPFNHLVGESNELLFESLAGGGLRVCSSVNLV
jgi:hypothetical protein